MTAQIVNNPAELDAYNKMVNSSIVSDPGEISAYNKLFSAPSSPSDLSQLAAGLKGAIAAAATGGQNIYNNVRGALQILGKGIGNNQPSILPASTSNFYNTLNVPAYARTGLPGFAENMIQYAPSMVNPIEGAETQLPTDFGWGPKIKAAYSNMIKDLKPRIANIGQQASIGSALSQNPLQGAKAFGGTQAVMEGLNPALRSVMWPLHAAGELVHPMKAASIFTNGLRNVYQNVLQKVKNEYSWMNPYSDQKFENPENLISPENAQEFKGENLKGYKLFLKNPTIGSAHKFQSDLGNYASSMDPLTEPDRVTQHHLLSARNELLEHITNKLNSLDPVAGLHYNQGRYLAKTQLYPLAPEGFFHNLATGEIEGDDPNKIVKQYKKAFPKKSDEPNNYLSQNVPILSQKTGLGHLMQYALPMGAGVLSTVLGAPHVDPMHLGMDLGGLGMGGAFARWAEIPIVKNMLQNQHLHEFLGKGNKFGRKISRFSTPAIATQFTNSLNNMPQNSNQ
jgi:hypothetical protein